MRTKDLRTEINLGGESFYTCWGLSRQLPSRNNSFTSLNTITRYVREGCPCFEHGGMTLFSKDLTDFMQWLKNRRPYKQIKAKERLRRIYGR